MNIEKDKEVISEKKYQTESGFQFLRVTSLSWLAKDLFELRLERGGIQFSPGNCISIYETEGEVSRPYSIASGTGDAELSFLIKHMDHGQVTDCLCHLNPGEKVKVSLPYGWFRPGQEIDEDPFVFVATGTGIAPFLSYCKSFPKQPPLKILYGVGKLEEAIGFEELKDICEVDLAISRETTENHFRGRVTDLIQKMNFTEHSHYFLCGLDSMIDDVTEILENRNVSSYKIHREVFFIASS